MDPDEGSPANVIDCDSTIALYEANGHDSYDPAILQIKRRRNFLLPVSRLHPELLHYVFQLALPNQRFGRNYDCHPFEYYDALFNIRQVSHSWDCEISTTPSFWTLTSSEFSSPFLDLVLERSQDAALDIVAVSRQGTGWRDYWRSTDAYWGEAVKAYLTRVMKRGIRELHALVPTAENLDPYIVDHLNPKMKVLSLYGEGQLTSMRPLQAPQLVDLHLVGCSLPWNHIHDLRSLSLNDATSPNLAQLVQLLQSSPMLQELKLKRVVPPSGGASNQVVVPADPIILPHLSTITIRNTSFDLASGLLYRLFPSTTCHVSIDQGLAEDFSDGSGFCRQAGRICIPGGIVGQGIEPRMFMLSRQLYFGMGPGRSLEFFMLDWIKKEKQSTTPSRTELARFFLEGGKGILSKASISRFHLHVEPRSVVAEGLAIVHDFFPDIVELNITIGEGMDMLGVLAEPINGEGNPGWPLPKLSIMNVRLFGEGSSYDIIITMAEKRMHAATSSPSALSAITTLRFDYGRVTKGRLESLDRLGIKYELENVAVL